MTAKTDSQEKIVKAASRLFQIKGYSATGLNEILRESGAPKGSLYYYFPNGKEELALAAIDLASRTMQEKVKTGLAMHRDPIQAISRVIEDMVSALKEDGKLQSMSLSMLALETGQTSEMLRDACASSFEKMENLYKKKLIENGFSKQKASELGVVLQSMIEGAITISVTKKDTAPLEVILQQLPALLYRKL